MGLNKLSAAHLRGIALRKLLLCFFILVAIIPTLFLGTWVQNNLLAAELSTVEDKHLLLAKNISSDLSNYATDLKAVFVAKSEAPASPISEEVSALLQSVNIKMLAIVEDGDIVEFCTGNSAMLPVGGLDQLVVERRKAAARPYRVMISPVMFSQQQEPTLYLSRIKYNGQLAIAAVSTAHFKQVQTQVIFGEGGHAAIVDQLGQAIAHPKVQWEQTAHNMSRLAPVQEMATGKTSGVARFFSPAAQTDMISGYATVPQTGWGVLIPQPYQEIAQHAQRAQRIALVITILGFLLAIAVSYLLTVYLLAPIRAVTWASHALASGELIADNPFEELLTVKGPIPREFHRLLLSFNQMAAEVSQARQDLELRVNERTQALQREVERRKSLEQHLIREATHDSLTGLPNRRLLTERLDSVLAIAARSHGSIALLFLDLDGFKQVNDVYGHPAGDKLLIQVAQRLRKTLRKSDSIFRIGGDEFVILVEQVKTEENLTRLSQKLLKTLQIPFFIGSAQITIGSSIGIKISHGLDGETPEQILSAADRAMYQAKVKGNCAIHYEQLSA